VRAVSGQAAAAPPTSVMNLRRRIASPTLTLTPTMAFAIERLQQGILIYEIGA